MRPLSVNTANLCRSDLSILKVIRLSHLAPVAVGIATVAAFTRIEMQFRDHTQQIGNRRLRRQLNDEISASAELSGIGDEGICCYSEMNLRFLIFSWMIFESSVDLGIPSFAAAPLGPATRPLHSANAASMISLS
jgi:hypothetical protein